MSTAIVQPGQIWRRKSDGRLTTVISVQSEFRASVLHKAKRRTHTETRNFIREYELVRESQK